MSRSTTLKRFRAVAIALAVTFLANYAISYAERSGASLPGGAGNPKPRVDVATNLTADLSRSGASLPGGAGNPRP